MPATNLQAQGDGDTLLAVAAREGEVDRVRTLLAEGADPDGGFSDWSPLMLAAMNGEVEIARLLLDAGALINRTNGEYGSALGVAAVTFIEPEEGVTAMVDLLLQRGALTETGNGAMMTPLMYAAREGKREVVNRLIAAGANAGHRDARGWSPLFFGVRSGDPEVVRMILESGADPNVATEYPTRRPINVAAELGSLEITRLLIEAGADVDGVDHNDEVATPILVATARGEWDLVRYLLEEGAWPNQSTHLYMEGVEEIDEAMTAMEWAELHEGSEAEEVAELIHIEGGLRTREIAEFVGRARESMRKKDVESLAFELGSGIDPMAYVELEDGLFSPFEYALELADPAVMEVVARNATIGYWPISNGVEIAAEHGQEGMTEFYLEHYPTWTLMAAIAMEDETLVRRAIVDDRIECEVSAGGLGTLLHFAVAEGDLSTLQELIERGCSVDAQDQDGATALLMAAGDGDNSMVKLLLERGASVDLPSNSGQTPLLVAARQGQWNAAKLLLDAGASVNIVDFWGWAPLHHAAWLGGPSLVQLLLDYGADPEAETFSGETAEEAAMISDELESGALLREAAEKHR